MKKTKKYVYLAGPDIFRPNAIEHMDKLKQLCRDRGLEPLSPMDNNLDISVRDKKTAAKIFDADVAMVRKADIVVANLSPFRGPSADVGTVFEVGMAFGLGKKVIGYTSDVRPYSVKCGEWIEFLEGLDDDEAMPGTFWYRDDVQLEDFGMLDNLMVDFGVYRTKCAIWRNVEAALDEAARIVLKPTKKKGKKQ